MGALRTTRFGVSNWRREDWYPCALLGVGLFLLLSESAVLIPNRDVFLEYPEFSIQFWATIFSMPIILFVGALWMFHRVGRTYSRTFPLNSPETALLVEKVLRSEGTGYSNVTAQSARMFLWKPDTVLKIERPDVKIEVLESKKASKYFGSVTRVYVGRFTKETKEDTLSLLTRLDRISELRPTRDAA